MTTLPRYGGENDALLQMLIIHAAKLPNNFQCHPSALTYLLSLVCILWLCRINYATSHLKAPPPAKEVSWYCNFDRMSQKSVNCYARGLGMAMTTCATVMHKIHKDQMHILETE
jgi:hypothetical protein